MDNDEIQSWYNTNSVDKGKEKFVKWMDPARAR